MRRELERFGPFAPILFIAIYALATPLFVPGSLLTLTGGAIFGPVMGALWNLLGATLGATIAFLIARYTAADWGAAGRRPARRHYPRSRRRGLAFRRFGALDAAVSL